MTAHVWTDGCRSGNALAPGSRAPGGWAAIIEKGSEGWTRRGHDPATTNVRMELAAMVAGLAALPNGCLVILHTDATVALAVRARWADRAGKSVTALRDADLWLALIDEFDRLDVGVNLLRSGARPHQHRRAHLIAREQAVAAGGTVALPRPSAARRRQMVASEQA